MHMQFSKSVRADAHSPIDSLIDDMHVCIVDCISIMTRPFTTRYRDYNIIFIINFEGFIKTYSAVSVPFQKIILN